MHWPASLPVYDPNLLDHCASCFIDLRADVPRAVQEQEAQPLDEEVNVTATASVMYVEHTIPLIVCLPTEYSFSSAAPT